MPTLILGLLGAIGPVSQTGASSVVFTNEARGVAWVTVEESEPYPRKVHVLRWHPDQVGMHIVVPSEGRVTVSNIVSRTQALAGVNGSFFDMETGLPTVFLKTPRRTYPGLDWDNRDGGALVWRESKARNPEEAGVWLDKLNRVGCYGRVASFD